MIAVPIVTADVALIALSILCIGLAFAFRSIVTYAVAAPLSHIPVIGGTISGAITGAIDSAYNTVVGWADGGLHLASDLWRAGSGLGTNLWAMTEAIAGNAATAIKHVNTVVIPVAAGYVYGLATSYVESRLLAVGSEITAVENSINAEIDRRIGAVGVEIGNVEGSINAEIRGDVAAIGTEIGAVEDSINAEIANRVAALGAEITAVENSINDEIARDVAALTNGIESQGTALLGDIVNVRGELLGDISVGDAATLAAATAATALVAEGVNTWLRDCGDPLCSGLSGLAKLLPGVEKLFESGLVFALVAAAAADPDGMATAVRETMSGAVESTDGLVRGVVGLAA